MFSSIRASAPGRTGIVGNPTDMYGGSVLSCTTTERAVCVLTPSDTDLTLTVAGETIALETAGDLQSHSDLFDLPRAVLRALEITPETHRFALTTQTDIPMQAGLAGSTALIAAIYGAVAKYLSIETAPHDTAEAIRRVEYEQMGVICGFQDQYMSVFGGLNFMDFREKGSHVAPDAQPLATVETLESFVAPLPLLLANTGVKHHSGSAHKPVRQRFLDGDAEVIHGYAHLAALARDAKAAVLRGDLQTLADAMNENLRIQQGFGASGEACDHLARVARENGGLAAKLAGAGHGGTVLVLTDDPARTGDALTKAGAKRILFPRPTPGLTVETW
ncbi:MAG: hypothetical protein H7Y38_09970 [Armatimonadetes bacterium]|nr:hypothetical protein [Armatimonadota bacterium]